MIRNKDASKESNGRRFTFDHLLIGLRNLKKPINWIILLIPFVVFYFIKDYRVITEYDFLQGLSDLSMKIAYIGGLILAEFIIFIYVVAYPLEARRIEDGLQATGFVNHLGVPPYLISKTINKNNKKIITYTFKGNSIPIDKWEDQRNAIEQSLNITIAKISYADGKDKIKVVCSKAIGDLPSCIYWNNKYLPKEKSVYCIGEGVQGNISIDLNKIPHVIIGGSTGSGKTQLLRFLLMQAINKNEIVYIADLKGGIDYQGKWKTSTHLCIDEEEVINILTMLENELNNRKKILENTGYHNISEYNDKTNNNIQRIIFACDEVAELLDTTGLSKEQKEKVKLIESKLSTLARLGRAFSINLFLATQRPDADIMPGQVKANIDYRIAGRCDEPLSRVLGVPDAHKLVPKDIAGRFMLYDGTLFQAYLFDEEKDIN